MNENLANLLKKKSNWTLLQDSLLCAYLEEQSNKTLKFIGEIEQTTDTMIAETNLLSLRLEIIHNSINELKSTKLVDERIVDDCTINDEAKVVIKSKTSEEETTETIRNALQKGFKLIDNYFKEVNIVAPDFYSDVDPNFLPAPVFEIIDSNRSLPPIIGTHEFNSCSVGNLIGQTEAVESISTMENITVKFPQSIPRVPFISLNNETTNLHEQISNTNIDRQSTQNQIVDESLLDDKKPQTVPVDESFTKNDLNGVSILTSSSISKPSFSKQQTLESAVKNTAALVAIQNENQVQVLNKGSSASVNLVEQILTTPQPITGASEPLRLSLALKLSSESESEDNYNRNEVFVKKFDDSENNVLPIVEEVTKPNNLSKSFLSKRQNNLKKPTNHSKELFSSSSSSLVSEDESKDVKNKKIISSILTSTAVFNNKSTKKSEEGDIEEMSKPVLSGFDSKFSDHLSAVINQQPGQKLPGNIRPTSRPVSILSIPFSETDKTDVINRRSVSRDSNVSSNEELGPTTVASRIAQIGNKIPVGTRRSVEKSNEEIYSDKILQQPPVIMPQNNNAIRPKGPSRRAPTNLGGKPPLAPVAQLPVSATSRLFLQSAVDVDAQPIVPKVPISSVLPPTKKSNISAILSSTTSHRKSFSKIKSIFDSSTSDEDDFLASSQDSAQKCFFVSSSKTALSNLPTACDSIASKSKTSAAREKPKKGLFDDSDSDP